VIRPERPSHMSEREFPGSLLVRRGFRTSYRISKPFAVTVDLLVNRTRSCCERGRHTTYTNLRSSRVHWDTLPTVLRTGPYRLFFYSADREEPPHVHVEREEGKAKFWLEPVRLEKSRGFGRAEIGRIERLVAENAVLLLRSWHEYFGG
jgi:hypothetical protein